MHRAALVIVAIAALISAGCVHTAGAAGPTYGLGRPADPAEITALDIDVSPDGSGLPDARGDAIAGARTFAATCARCHGAAVRLDPQRWPYATTLFDYVRRAMPPDRSTKLRADEVYAITAYELAVNGVIDRRDVLDRTTLPRVTMPGLKAFFTAP